MFELTGPEWTQSHQKRLADIIGITALAPGLSLVGAATAASIATIDTMSPVFAQTRYGLNLEPFTFYKFQTMPEGTPETPSEGSSGDPRATHLGKLLRETHLDEVLQGVNVVRGEMSLVGPRPLIRADVEATMDALSPAEQREWKTARAVAKPGVFGNFQLNQHNNGYQTDIVYARAMSDIEYVAQASFLSDSRIIIASVGAGLGIPHIGPKEDREHLRGSRGALMLDAVATGMQISTGQSDREYWRNALLGARTLDDVVDHEHVVDVAPHVKLLLSGKAVGDMTTEEATHFSDIYWELPEAQRLRLIGVYLALPDMLQRKREAHDAKELATVSKAEALLFADILKLQVAGPDSAARQKFNDWLVSFAIAGYMIDAAVDLRKDYDAGNIGFYPTKESRALFLRHGLAEIGRTFTVTPPSTYGRLARTALRTLFL